MHRLIFGVVTFIGVMLVFDWFVCSTINDADPRPSSIAAAWSGWPVLAYGIGFLLLSLLIAYFGSRRE